jgi:hypothetical protein
MAELPSATILASCFRSKLAYRNAGRLRSIVADRTGCAAWSDFQAYVASTPLFVADSFASGVAFWPGGAQVAAEFKVAGDVQAVRNCASSIAKEFELSSVRVNFESGAEAELFALDHWLSDWRIEYLLAADSDEARADTVWWLTKEAEFDVPSGRVIGDRLIFDAGIGFVARAHRYVAAEFGRPLSVASVLVERWGGDGVQRGFLREQRLERAPDAELGRILRA